MEISDRIGRYQLKPFVDSQTGTVTRPRTTEEYTAMIRNSVHFARDKGGRIHIFQEGVYKPTSESVVDVLVRDICVYYNVRWNTRLSNEVSRYTLLELPELWDRPPLEVINLKNGLYHWGTEMFMEHTPAHLSVVQIPIEYDRSATCPAWDKFLGEVLPGGESLLIEIIGLCMIPFTGLQKCIVLVGGGSNGKSTYLNGLQAAVGENNICNVDMHKLVASTDRFSRAAIVGKLVNVFGDMSARKIEDTANFKPLTGEDKITIEYKGKDTFPYRPFCKLVFSCNEVPKADDASEGYKRRFIHIPFTQRFEVNPRKGQELADALSSPRELSGLLNRILPRLNSIVDDGFSITPEIAAIIDEWCVMPDKTRVWLEQNVKRNIDGLVPQGMLYNYYTEKCPCTEAFERRKLITYLKNLFPGIEAGVVAKLNGKATRCHRGIEMIDPAVQAWMEETALKGFVK